VQPGLHVDVGGIAEGGNERHAHGQFVDDLLAAGDLVVQRDDAAFDHHVVQGEARRAFVGLGRLFGLGGRHLGHALLDVGEIEAGDVFAHDRDGGRAQGEAIDHGGEPEQRRPGGADVQFGGGEQRGLRAGLGHGEIARAHGQGEGIEADLADGDVAADHLGHVLGQDVMQDLGDLPCCNAAQDQRHGHDAQENLA
jgi:hypothetical protein